jgi:hypothetical protein
LIMKNRTIKDPTYSIYKDGGNVENKAKAAGKDELLKLAKDEADIRFDVEGEIIDILQENYQKEKKPGQSFLDWLDTKPRSYFLKIPLSLKDGGNVILLSDYLKQKEKPKIKRINLDSAAPGRTLDSLTEAEREVVNKLLRMTFGKED